VAVGVREGSVRFWELLVGRGTEHGAVLAAVRALLADGQARSAEDLCALGIQRGLLPAETIPNYVRNAIKTLLDRQRDRAIEALVARLAASAHRQTPAAPGDGGDIGAPFERDVAAAFTALGLNARRLGGEGEPDVIATAPLGDHAYTVVVECKTVATERDVVDNPAAQEAGRLRDQVGGTYAVLLGPAFPKAAELDGELQAHRVALWAVDDLVALLRAHAAYPVRWSRLVPLFAPGRSAAAIAALAFEHLHGARKRAHVAYRYVLEEGLRYQELLASDDPEVERPAAPLTLEALTVLVNERLARERDEGRVSVDDVRAAVAYGAHPLVEAIAVDGERVTVEVRAPRDAMT
jgi:hypothetical protein